MLTLVLMLMRLLMLILILSLCVFTLALLYALGGRLLCSPPLRVDNPALSDRSRILIAVPALKNSDSARDVLKKRGVPLASFSLCRAKAR